MISLDCYLHRLPLASSFFLVLSSTFLSCPASPHPHPEISSESLTACSSLLSWLTLLLDPQNTFLRLWSCGALYNSWMRVGQALCIFFFRVSFSVTSSWAENLHFDSKILWNHTPTSSLSLMTDGSLWRAWLCTEGKWEQKQWNNNNI